VEKSRIFRDSGKAFGYLDEEDKYLFARPNPQFSFGFIGCGNMGQEHMFNTLLEGRAGIGGIYDQAERSSAHAVKRLQAAGHTTPPKIYSSIQDACADPDTHALIISTPNHTHIDVVREVAGCDKALFLEKPIATTVADAMEIYELLSTHPHPVQIGLQYRYKSVYAEAIEEVFNRASLGQVHSVHMLEHRFPFLDKVDQWNKFDTNTGGTLVEKCCHYFDLINLFAGGHPRRVYATGSQGVNFKEFERDGRKADGLDQANVLIEYDNGATGNFSLNMFTPGSREELIICGDQGRLHTVESSRLGGRNQNTLSLWAGDNGTSREVSPSYPPHIASAGHHGSTFYEHVALVELLLGNTSPQVNPPSLVDAVWSVLVASAAQQSIAESRPVDVFDIKPDGLPARGANKA